MNLLKTLLITCATATTPVFAQGVYNFNTSQADFNANFTNVSTGFSTLWQSTGGVSNGGSLDTTSSNNTAYYTGVGGTANAGQFTTAGDSKYVSYFFLAGINTSQNFDGRVSVGFNTSTTVTLDSGSYVYATVATLANNGTTATSQALEVKYRNAGSGAATIDTAFGVLTNNNWYELRLNLNYSGSNLYTASVNLYDWGADGATGGSVVDSFSVSALTSSAGGTLSTLTGVNLYAGFIGANANAGLRAQQIDNFSATGIAAVPEPSAFAAVAGLVILGFAGVRRRSTA